MEEKELLTGHVLYGLDQAILTYLDSVLEDMIGVPFRDYRDFWKAAARRRAERVERKGRKLAASASAGEIESQEQLLPGAWFEEDGAAVWDALIENATAEQRQLCALYNEVLQERYDLEHMMIAVQTARKFGEPAYAAQVRKVIGIEEEIVPVWWPGQD